MVLEATDSGLGRLSGKKGFCYCSCSWTNQMLEVNIKLTYTVGSRPSFMNKTPVVFTYFAHLYLMYKVPCTWFSSLENDWEMLCKYWITSGTAGLHLAKLVLSVGKSQRKLYRDGSHKICWETESLMLWWWSLGKCCSSYLHKVMEGRDTSEEQGTIILHLLGFPFNLQVKCKSCALSGLYLKSLI